MTDIISPDCLETLKLGRMVYYGLKWNLHDLIDHYLCDEYFATLIKKCRS